MMHWFYSDVVLFTFIFHVSSSLVLGSEDVSGGKLGYSRHLWGGGWERGEKQTTVDPFQNNRENE